MIANVMKQQTKILEACVATSRAEDYLVHEIRRINKCLNSCKEDLDNTYQLCIEFQEAKKKRG
jgi:hypothetical protein